MASITSTARDACFGSGRPSEARGFVARNTAPSRLRGGHCVIPIANNPSDWSRFADCALLSLASKPKEQDLLNAAYAARFRLRRPAFEKEPGCHRCDHSGLSAGHRSQHVDIRHSFDWWPKQSWAKLAPVAKLGANAFRSALPS